MTEDIKDPRYAEAVRFDRDIVRHFGDSAVFLTSTEKQDNGSKPIPGLKPGAFGLLHAWLTDSVYTDGYVIPSLDPLTLRNSHRPRDCRPKEIPPVQETPGV